jgi:hypothetical protein
MFMGVLFYESKVTEKGGVVKGFRAKDVATKFFLTYVALIGKYSSMITNSFFAYFNFYFWYGFSFRPSARVEV